MSQSPQGLFGDSKEEKGLISLKDDVQQLCANNGVKIFNVSELDSKSITEIDSLLKKLSLTTYSELASSGVVAFAAKNTETGKYVGCVIANNIDGEKCNIDVIGSTQRSVGSLLMLSLTDHLEEFGLSDFYLYAAKREGDDSARRFYAKIGLNQEQKAEGEESSKFLGAIPLSKRQEIVKELGESSKKMKLGDL